MVLINNLQSSFDKAKEELGFDSVTTFEEDIKKTIKWYDEK